MKDLKKFLQIYDKKLNFNTATTKSSQNFHKVLKVLNNTISRLVLQQRPKVHVAQNADTQGLSYFTIQLLKMENMHSQLVSQTLSEEICL